ncbi:MAG: gamma-glutamyl-gamma-aminobutyrate hydrolase family protein [Anaerolineae bacterium]|nr:gamma-glutamyl-gamma-aminobutyrate hydrolase family protein [Anaerolineae bacterium]
MKPIIGITTFQYHSSRHGPTVALARNYAESVSRAGGVPVLLPAGVPPDEVGRLLRRLDGVLLSGGADLDPHLFGASPHPRVYGIDANRDGLELALVREALAGGMPLLGICRGIQVMNVALGGSLFIHIPDQLPGALLHDMDGHPRSTIAHPVRLRTASKLAVLLAATEVGVNSYHHQGIDRLAANLTATAWSPDDLVEAVELDHHPFFVGVQWHPESMPDDPYARRLFAGFIQAAAAGKAG